MSHQKFWRSEHGMSSVDLAVDYARKMIQTEARGPGDLDPALARLEAKTGIGYWTLRGLWYGRRKLVDRDLFVRLRGAYLSLCERQVSAIQTDLAFEKARGGDDTLDDLAAEVEALAAKIRAAKTR